MNNSPETSEQNAAVLRPPQILRSLVGGFQTVANNIGLILFPLVLDLLLWFGPHLRIKQMFEPSLEETLAMMRRVYPSSASQMVNDMEKTARTFLEGYNLLGSLSTFPIGVPSQMSAFRPTETPMGSPQIVELNSLLVLILGWLGLTLLGLVLASIYFAIVARACSRQPGMAAFECGPSPASGPARLLGRTGNSLPGFRAGVLAWQTLQVLTLVILLTIVFLVVMVPVLVVVALLAQVSMFIAWLALMLVGFVVVWVLIPLAFSPHGIFLCGQSLLNAMLNSTRVVRYSLPGTGLFLTAVILLGQVMGSLWVSAPASSWMTVVGLFGHAFVSTALLAATFVYYRHGLTYVQNLRGMAQRSSI